MSLFGRELFVLFYTLRCLAVPDWRKRHRTVPPNFFCYEEATFFFPCACMRNVELRSNLFDGYT